MSTGPGQARQWLVGAWRWAEPKGGIRLALFVAAVVAAFLAYAIAIWRAPDLLDQRLIRDPHIKPAEALTAQHNARLMVISLGGALAVVIGLLYTARNYRLARRGQITDRFAKALERLDSDQMYVRIGGVHALEHLMRDSADHHADVLEVLVAFVRNRTPRARRDDPGRPFISGRPPLPKEPDVDVQAALIAIGRRPERPHRERGWVNLSWLHLALSLMGRARLAEANLVGAELQEADLRAARLQGADLRAAHLQGADLVGAQLQQAWLEGAQLQQADLAGALFEGAELAGAQFCDPDGSRRARNLTAEALIDAYIDDTTLLPQHLRDELERLKQERYREGEQPTEGREDSGAAPAGAE